MFAKYLKDNALENMKVELSKMKSEHKSIHDKNCEIFKRERSTTNYISVKDLPRDIAILEDFIDLTERNLKTNG
ncbi:hypothetical protein N9U90_05775 [Candidatus Pelagibacter sp.]|nr:hypothetical protein [Candidatus Pelagibacter sp.]